MINETNGEIQIPGYELVIKPSLARSDLLNSQYYKDLFDRRHDISTGYQWFYFKPLIILNYPISFCFCFHGEALDSVHFYENSDEFPASWSTWSESAELKRKADHDRLLQQILRRPPDEDADKPIPYTRFDYPWGTILSCFDPKAGDSSVIVRYHLPS